MKKNLLVAFFAITAAACSACDDSQNVKKGDTGTESNYSISVLIDDESAGEVDITTMQDKVQSVTAGGQESQAIAISDIIEQSTGLKGADLDKYLCDYESGDDGFRPSSKGDRCPPLSCSYTTKSYLNVESNNLFYADDAPQTNGCYNVHHVSKIILITSTESTNPPIEQPPAESAWEIAIYVDGVEFAKVDISTLETNAGGFVDISTIFKAVGVSVDLSSAKCEGVAEDGYRPSTGKNEACHELLSCEDFAKGDVSLDDKHKLVIKTAESCYGTKYLNRIDIVTK